MTSRNDGGPAFPNRETKDTLGRWDGMSLRDYFAAKALPFVLTELGDGQGSGDAACDAYRIADAMLKAREGGAS